MPLRNYRAKTSIYLKTSRLRDDWAIFYTGSVELGIIGSVGTAAERTETKVLWDATTPSAEGAVNESGQLGLTHGENPGVTLEASPISHEVPTGKYDIMSTADLTKTASKDELSRRLFAQVGTAAAADATGHVVNDHIINPAVDAIQGVVQSGEERWNSLNLYNDSSSTQAPANTPEPSSQQSIASEQQPSDSTTSHTSQTGTVNLEPMTPTNITGTDALPGHNDSSSTAFVNQAPASIPEPAVASTHTPEPPTMFNADNGPGSIGNGGGGRLMKNLYSENTLNQPQEQQARQEQKSNSIEPDAPPSLK